MSIVALDALIELFDVCIIGAGPAGMACALALRAHGLKTLLLDAGARQPVPGNPDILAAETPHSAAHGPTELVSASALGGSSHWWGGRLVPFDPLDFRAWPVSHEEIAPWYRKADAQLRFSGPSTRPAPGAFSKLSSFTCDGTESWLPTPNLARLWNRELNDPNGPAVLLGARVIGLDRQDSVITGAQVMVGGQQRTVRARNFVLAGGGLGSIRLMLLAQRADPQLFGGPDGPLGRSYMGHISGSISSMVFTDRQDAATFAYFADRGHIARRRIVPLERAALEGDFANIAFWLSNPKNTDPLGDSAASSARYLAARAARVMAGKSTGAMSPSIRPHVSNVSRAPVAAAVGLSGALLTLAASRVTRQNYRPKRFLATGRNAWRLVYHAEQKPDPANRLSLSQERDSLGLPKLKIAFDFADADINSVVRAHDALDADLRAAGAGSLAYLVERERLADKVRSQATDGYHQIGGAIMSSSPAEGVVDTSCRAHGLENFFVASSCVFPSGGQANPTYTILALTHRLADHIANLRRSISQPVGAAHAMA